MLELRQLEPDDWQVWRAVRLQALAGSPDAFGSTLASWRGAGDSEARWRGRLADVPLNVVAVVDGQPVGQVGGTAVDERGTVELISLWVAPVARGTGVGDQLVNEVVRWATVKRADAVTLAVKKRNALAIRLYERTGFTTVEAMADPDEQVMSRTVP